MSRLSDCKRAGKRALHKPKERRSRDDRRREGAEQTHSLQNAPQREGRAIDDKGRQGVNAPEQ